MHELSLQEVYQRVAPFVFRVAVQNLATEKWERGTAFHIGDGYLVTANHVVEGIAKGIHRFDSLSNSYYEESGMPALEILEILTPQKGLVQRPLSSYLPRTG